jgi:hypothetical protein
MPYLQPGVSLANLLLLKTMEVAGKQQQENVIKLIQVVFCRTNCPKTIPKGEITS